jgi:hypothetical protein
MEGGVAAEAKLMQRCNCSSLYLPASRGLLASLINRTQYVGAVLRTYIIAPRLSPLQPRDG